jgi:hypothetical protein
MDTLKDHFSVSIFQKLNQEFWNPSVSYRKKTILTYRVDAWHIFKSITIILICFAIVFYQSITIYPLVDVAILGMVWNITFEIVYRLLKRK